MNQADAKAVSELTYKEFASKKINIDIVDEGMSDFLKIILEKYTAMWRRVFDR